MGSCFFRKISSVSLTEHRPERKRGTHQVPKWGISIPGRGRADARAPGTLGRLMTSAGGPLGQSGKGEEEPRQASGDVETRRPGRLAWILSQGQRESTQWYQNGNVVNESMNECDEGMKE